VRRIITVSTPTESRLESFRKRRDVHFKESENSPLRPEQKEIFTGLKYFPENRDLALALELDTSGEGIEEELTIGTVNGQAKQYIRAGRIHFEVEGQPVTLTVFKDTNRGHFFLPFRDATAGAECYSVGRYLEPRALPDGRLAVDFNQAYNPYCAYNEGWSCPIPPFENRISAPIRAGEIMPDFVAH
jgi:uncharacterized protein (DUF1684 family)